METKVRHILHILHMKPCDPFPPLLPEPPRVEDRERALMGREEGSSFSKPSLVQPLPHLCSPPSPFFSQDMLKMQMQRWTVSFSKSSVCTCIVCICRYPAQHSYLQEQYRSVSAESRACRGTGEGHVLDDSPVLVLLRPQLCALVSVPASFWASVCPSRQ